MNFTPEDYIESISKTSGVCVNLDCGDIYYDGFIITVRMNLDRFESIEEWKKDKYCVKYTYRDFSFCNMNDRDYIGENITVCNDPITEWTTDAGCGGIGGYGQYPRIKVKINYNIDVVSSEFSLWSQYCDRELRDLLKHRNEYFVISEIKNKQYLTSLERVFLFIHENRDRI
jgi:hypothetical protein